MLKSFDAFDMPPAEKQNRSCDSWFVVILGIIIIGLPWFYVSRQIQHDYERTMEASARETLNLAKAFEQHVQGIISDADRDLLILKAAYERGGISNSIFAAYEEIAAIDQSRSLVAIHNEQGIVIKSYIQNALGEERADREYFKHHRDALTNELFIGTVINARPGGQDVIPLSRRFNNPDGSFGGIVHIGLSVDYFLSNLDAIELGQDRLISLTGLDGFSRAHTVGSLASAETNAKCNLFWQKIQAGSLSGTFKTDQAGDETARIISYCVVPNYPLAILVGQSIRVALAEHEKRKGTYIVAVSLFSVVVLLFCGLLIHRNQKLRQQKVLLKQTNKKLVESSEQFRALVENSPDCISRLDRQGRRLYVNQASLHYLPGYTCEEIFGMTSEEIGLSPAYCTILQEGIESVFTTGISVQKIVQLIYNEGPECFDWRLVPEYDSNGNVSTVLSTSRNITEYVTIRQQLEESEQIYRNLVDTACAIIMTTNSRGEILFMNNYGLSFFGYCAEELIGRTFYGTIIPEYDSKDSNLRHEIADHSFKVEAPHYVSENITRSGKRVWADWSSRVYVDPKTGDQNMLSVGIDIHERKLMEEELKRHRDNLQQLVEEQVVEISQINAEKAEFFSSICDPFFVLDSKWHLIYVNNEVKQFDPRLDNACLGQSIWDVLVEQVDGELFQKLNEACVGNKSLHTVIKSVNSDKVFDAHLYPYTKGLLVYLRDITEQERYEADLMRLDRLNLVGEMAAGIGHEIRNPLTTVRGYLQFFMLKAKYAEYISQFTIMIEELDKANGIITEYLSLAKNKTIALKRGNINTILEALSPLLQAEAYHCGHSLEIEMQAIPDIWLDGNEIRQMVLNLVRNGIEAMEQNGKITLKSYIEAGKVVLAVSDTGKGIPKAVMDKLGTPFFSTKEGKTGLGLAVCYRVADRHGGKIEVETTPKGTTFYVKFGFEMCEAVI